MKTVFRKTVPDARLTAALALGQGDLKGSQLFGNGDLEEFAEGIPDCPFVFEILLGKLIILYAVPKGSGQADVNTDGIILVIVLQTDGFGAPGAGCGGIVQLAVGTLYAGCLLGRDRKIVSEMNIIIKIDGATNLSSLL